MNPDKALAVVQECGGRPITGGGAPASWCWYEAGGRKNVGKSGYGWGDYETPVPNIFIVP